MRDITAPAFRLLPDARGNQLQRTFARCLFSLIALFLGTFALAQAPSDGLQPGQSLGAYLGIRSQPNLRDVGGYKTEEGLVVKKGVTYRSNAFNPMTSDALVKIEPLKLRDDYDLRTTAEIAVEPDIVPSGVRYIHLDVLADEAGLAMPPNQIAKIFQDPKVANEKLGGVAGVDAMFMKIYQGLIVLPSANKSYRSLFLFLSTSTTSPNVFHCTNGKDRTGWAAASLLTLLGVPKDKVYEDYLKSNDYLLPFHQKAIDEFVAKGGDAAIPVAIFGVKRSYLDAAFNEMYHRYGTIERYFSEGLNINTTQQKKLREIYLTRNVSL